MRSRGSMSSLWSFMTAVAVWERSSTTHSFYGSAGAVVLTVWDRLPTRFPTILLDAFVVMPNHVHGIVFLGANPAVADEVAIYGDLHPETQFPYRNPRRTRSAATIAKPHCPRAGRNHSVAESSIDDQNSQGLPTRLQMAGRVLGSNRAQRHRARSVSGLYRDQSRTMDPGPRIFGPVISDRRRSAGSRIVRCRLGGGSVLH